MSAYWAVLSARFRMLLQYRTAAMAGVVTQVFWGLIRVMIFTAFYDSCVDPDAIPMTRQQLIGYVWLGQAMLALLPWIRIVDADVAAMVRSGTLAYELVRPVDLYGFWFVRAVAQRGAPTLLRAVPLFIVAWLFFGLELPAPAAGAAWLAATGGVLLLASAIATLATISTLWTLSSRGTSMLIGTIVYMLSGMLIPLPLYPEWAQGVIRLLPFRSLLDLPFRLYVGHLPPGAVLGVLAEQLIWAAALVLAGRFFLARSMRRVVVQGG